MAERQADERAARQADRDAGCARRTGTAGTAGRRCRPAPRRPGATRSPKSTPGARASRNQRRLPAADSITDIMCQRPGTAWQKAWTRPRGSYRGRSVAAKTTPDVPERQRHRPRRDDADADRIGRLVAAAGDDRGAGTQPGGGGGLGRDHAGHLGSFAGRRQPGRIDPERGDDLARPVAGRQVEQQRPGAVRLVEHVVAGQPEPQVVLGKQDMGDPPPDVRFVVPHPDELRRGEPGECVVAGDRDEPLRPDRRTDRIALGRGALVVPQDRRAEDRIGCRRGGRGHASVRSGRSRPRRRRSHRLLP